MNNEFDPLQNDNTSQNTPPASAAGGDAPEAAPQEGTSPTSAQTEVPPAPPVYPPVGGAQSAAPYSPQQPYYPGAQQVPPGYIPYPVQPYPPAGQYTPYYGAYPPPKPKKKWNAGKIALCIIAGILELAIISFAVYGVYAMCSGGVGRGTVSGSGNQFQIPWYGNNGGNGQLPGNSVDPTTEAKMGLSCREVTEAMAKQYNLEQGMMIAAIDSDSDANGKDIQVNDIITHMNGERISSFDDYYDFMEDKKAGDEVELTLLRPGENGEENQTVTVKIKLLKRESENSSETTPNYPRT